MTIFRQKYFTRYCSYKFKVWWIFNNHFTTNFWRIRQWRNFENPLRFDRVTARSSVLPFLRHSVVSRAARVVVVQRFFLLWCSWDSATNTAVYSIPSTAARSSQTTHNIDHDHNHYQLSAMSVSQPAGGTARPPATPWGHTELIAQYQNTIYCTASVHCLPPHTEPISKSYSQSTVLLLYRSVTLTFEVNP